ncbi:MAG: tetratricopeptide repeat-containing sensor histidine kinase [Bacteroidota bacterium]
MEARAKIEAQWQQLYQGLARGNAGVNECLGFFEKIVVSNPHEVIAWSEPVLKKSEEIGYELGVASSLALKGYALTMFSKYDKALPLLNKALKLIEPLNNPHVACKIVGSIANVHTSLGDLDKALSYGNRTLELLKLSGDKEQEGWVLNGFGMAFEEVGQLDQAFQYYQQSLQVFKEIGHDTGIGRALTGIGSTYQKKGSYLEALPFHEESLQRFHAANNKIGEARALNDLGSIALEQGEIDKAQALHTQSLEIRRAIKHRQSQSTSLFNLGKVYIAKADYDTAIELLEAAMDIAREVNIRTREVQIHEVLSSAYEQAGNLEKALHHFRTHTQQKESLFTEELNRRFATIEVSHELDRAEKEAEIERLKNVELREKNQQLETLLSELKNTQSQLIQTEKLVSLGNLTAGIAHELKNPLNFVNNFAELSVELMSELDEALTSYTAADKTELPAEVGELLTTLRFNTGKVNEHGKRADKIVRSMLEHAGGREGAKEALSINDLLKDYSKLAYHGMRAADRSFQVNIEHRFMPDNPVIDGVSQDLGRVFLNLLNNAFYTTQKKAGKNLPDYIPTVIIETLQAGEYLSVRIHDNGEGIPEKHRQRIFEPFFTSKPSGSGTGLGLFLSYEIIVQGHAGELLVESKSGKGSIFIVNLPLRQG